jgi:hypothetical protein
VRIAFLPDERTPNTLYRSVGPMVQLRERGHETRDLDPENRKSWNELLRWCELFHMHRVCDAGAVELARAAKQTGATVVWDDDDDVTRVPRSLAGYREAGGYKGARRLQARARLFEHVDLVTTPSPVLADAFRAGGAREVQVIENHVIDGFVEGRAPRNGRVEVGWTAGEEHKLDVEQIPVVDALRRLLERHPDVHVTTFGLRLEGLPPERYDHIGLVTYKELLRRAAAFDVGIAPLSPAHEISRARSNVKLKEYSAVGVPWLASPIGPYAGLGERQGGRLVADDRWFDELDALIGSERTRRKLARRAAKWGREQLLSRHVAAWERSFEHLLARVRGRG